LAGFDAVAYLSLRLYPAKAVNKARADVSEGRIRDAAEDYVRGAEIFERALQALSPAALKALVDDEQELEAIQLRAHTQNQEQIRFFNRPDAAADFSFWAKQACWSLDEAVALILGKEPKVVNWDRIAPMTPSSEFARRFSDIREHLIKARRNGQLIDPVRPDQFFRWTRARGVTLPAKLESLLDGRQGKTVTVGDGSTVGTANTGGNGFTGKDRPLIAGARPCDSEPKGPRSRRATRTVANAAEVNENVIHLDREEARLKAMRDRSPVEKVTADFQPPDLADSLVQSLRKMILAMAIGRYGYRRHQGRQSTVTDISVDLKAAGIELPIEAVQALLEQASHCLSDDADASDKVGANG